MKRKLFKSISVVILFSIVSLHFMYAQNLEKIGSRDMLKVSGATSLTGILFHADNTNNYRPPFTWYFNGNLTFNVLDVSLPFNYSYSNNKNKFSQPFNMTSISPSYKWIKAYIGQTSMNFSPYTLAGHLFTGAGLELTPGKWKFNAMYGIFKKAVEYDFLLQSDANMSYLRKGGGFKAGYDGAKGSLALIVFKANDDPESLTYHPSATSVKPMDNTVVGIGGKLKIYKSLSVDADAAFSGLNSNISSEAMPTEIQVNYLPFIFNPNVTARFYKAIRASMLYSKEIFGVGINYERVDPGYQTLGAYFFNNDIENLTISPQFRFYKGKLSASFNSGIQRNNLDHLKMRTNNRWVGSANVNIVPADKWSIALGYSNFTCFTRTRPVTDPYYLPTPADTLNFYQLNRQGNATISKVFGTNIQHSLVIGSSYMQARQRTGNIQSPELSVCNFNGVYSMNFKKSGTSVSIVSNANISNTSSFRTVLYGPGASVSKKLLKDVLKINLGYNYNKNITNEESNGYVSSARLTTSFLPKVKNKKYGAPSVSLSSSWVTRYTGQAKSSEMTGNIILSYSF